MAWWPFKRRARSSPLEASPPAGDDSAEDWAVGDLAECLHGNGWWGGFGGPRKGDTYVVKALYFGTAYPCGKVGLGLSFSPWPHSFWHSLFRKITPKADAATRADAAFVETIRPKVST